MNLNKNALVDLLNHTIKERRDLSWKMGTGYHNGIDISIYEILIYEVKNNKTNWEICLNGDSGELVNQRIMGQRQKNGRQYCRCSFGYQQLP